MGASRGAPDEGGSQGLAGVEGEVVRPIDLDSHGAARAGRGNVQAEQAVLSHVLKVVRNAHVAQHLADVHVEAAAQRVLHRLLPYPAQPPHTHLS